MEKLKLTLSNADYQQCLNLCRKGTSHISMLNRAQVLIAMHNGADIPVIIKVLGIDSDRHCYISDWSGDGGRERGGAATDKYDRECRALV